jgi:hypothetical protein
MADIAVIKAFFERMPEESKKEVRETYGDDLSKWYEDYWKFREERIVKRAKKLADIGFDVKGMAKEIEKLVQGRIGK